MAVVWSLLGAGALAFGLFLLYNNVAVTRRYRLETDKTESDWKLVLLSDLHNKVYGKENRPLLNKIAALQPDVIVIAGDLVDKRKPQIAVGVAFANACGALAPTFYLCGNHERERGTFEEICSLLQGVTVLRDEWVSLGELKLMGVTDHFELPFEKPLAVLREFEKQQGYKIVAVHRPADFYSEMEVRDHNVDLQLSGHTHGGVAHLPFYGAIFAPGEGFFPRYAQGHYRENGTDLIVGGGLGNTRLPIRLFNFPEIVEISIKSKKTLAK